MAKHYIIALLALSVVAGSMHSQIVSTSSTLVTQPVTDRIVPFRLSDTGVSKPITWGLDLAWLSRDNVVRGMAFMGAERVDVIRSSFTPTAALVNGELPTTERSRLNQRLNIIRLLPAATQVVLNCDHPSVAQWYKGNAANWAQLIDVTTRLHTEAGRKVITVSPFNEPDYTATGQGTRADFYAIAGELRKNPRFDTIRISGGNTLNDDVALEWYNALRGRLDEGNTHQLAGSFNNYAAFFQAVRADGKHATNDELHNVMEAMVGAEYGMQTGIWWGTAEYARGEFVKASDGMRLAYAEHRPNWTAASVYRTPEGKIQAFGGTSERQAATTSYRFVSKERDVYFDGHGPQREYTITLPGGTGYQNGQTNAECVVSITHGDDVQPVINGQYSIINRNSKKVMGVQGAATAARTNITQLQSSGQAHQMWKVTPVDTRIGGDFSYYTFIAAHTQSGTPMAIDLLDYSLNNNGTVILYGDAKGANQQWYLQYAEDGYFYIRSRHSAKCLQARNASTIAGAQIVQSDFVEGNPNQQWRFVPAGSIPEFEAPAAPANLTATSQPASILLEWNANTEEDLVGYNIYRAEAERAEANGDEYETIARNVVQTQFVDNTAEAGVRYKYAVRAVDTSLNRSEYSNVASESVSSEQTMKAHLSFENNLFDNTVNSNHVAASKTPVFTAGKNGERAISLSVANGFVQLPATIANSQEITIALWTQWRGTGNWQRIFDFGNGEDENMFLTTRADNGKLRFGVKYNGVEYQLDGRAQMPQRVWTHVAVTMSSNGASLYINGELVSSSADIRVSPRDLNPVLNYLGRSQYAADPLFAGYIDDVRIYNYALSADRIAALVENSVGIEQLPTEDAEISEIYNMQGQLIATGVLAAQAASVRMEAGSADTAPALPAGIYIIKYTDGTVKKIMINNK